MASLSNCQNDLHEQGYAWTGKLRLPRRLSARLGLQGKLILCFMLLLSLAVGTSCWIFSRQSAGCVTVGVSQEFEASQLRQINYVVVGIGCVLLIISMPLAYVLVHRVFLPIRQLVEATNRIAAGDLDARVAIHRSDVIGVLARSFNE